MLAAKQKYSARDLARLIDSGTFERTVLANKKLSTVLTEFPENTVGVFKDSYVFDFLNLPEDHLESDLRSALVKNLKKFLLELGPDFTLMGEEFTIKTRVIR
jgi:predicted nuclease of restriction endonuclease-like (RecB) superfamily